MERWKNLPNPGHTRLAPCLSCRLFGLTKGSFRWSTFTTRLSHPFTGTCFYALALTVNIGIQSLLHLHPQRLLAALPRSPFQFLERAQNDLCRGPDLVGAFNFDPVALLYFLLPFSVRPPPWETESFSPRPTEILGFLDIIDTFVSFVELTFVFVVQQLVLINPPWLD